MQTDQRVLDKAVEAARRAQTAIGHIVILSDGRVEALARVADDAIALTVAALLESGADDEGQRIADEFAMEIPFHALVPPDLEPLRESLLAARALADRVDTARGRAHADGEGLDLGDSVRMLLARVELELRGPDAAVTGGRE